MTDLYVEVGVDRLISAAGRQALAFRRSGFHCSESVFLAVNQAVEITDPGLVRLMSGFHGGAVPIGPDRGSTSPPF